MTTASRCNINTTNTELSGPASKFSGGGLERQTSKDESTRGSVGMLRRKILILTPLKCREIHLKLTNEILKYKLSGLKKQYFYPIETDKQLFSPIIKFTIIH